MLERDVPTVCKNYRSAKDKRLQILIDADVYAGTNVGLIVQILNDNGYDTSDIKWTKKETYGYAGVPKEMIKPRSMYKNSTDTEKIKKTIRTRHVR